jgi:hypothetical protein
MVLVFKQIYDLLEIITFFFFFFLFKRNSRTTSFFYRNYSWSFSGDRYVNLCVSRRLEELQADTPCALARIECFIVAYVDCLRHLLQGPLANSKRRRDLLWNRFHRMGSYCRRLAR